jgi:hypothetical protein
MATSDMLAIATLAVNALPFLVNAGVLIYLLVTRQQMGLGFLAGFGSALAIALVLGVVATIACFVMLGSYN